MVDKVCWNLTNVCDKECIYCFRELFESAQDLETNLKVLKNLVDLGVTKITFSGGEPMLYPYLKELLIEANNKGIECSMVTGGNLLNIDNIDDYIPYLSKLILSCDSPRIHINKTLGRGEKSYEHIKEILPIIREKYNDNRLKVEINTVVIRDDANEYLELEHMLNHLFVELLKYKISRWKIIRFYPLRGKAKDEKDRFDINPFVFELIKDKYETNSSFFEITVRDHKDLDDNYIVSPEGILKTSENGEEIVIKDMKEKMKVRKKGVKHV